MNDLLLMIFIPLLATGVAYHAGLHQGRRSARLARLVAGDWLRLAKDTSGLAKGELDPATLRFCAAHLSEVMKADAPDKEAR